MKTEHRVHIGDARELAAVTDDSVELVVTSPPYPMIDMWDALFAELNPDVADRLEAGAGSDAFELMHDELARVWDQLDRVLVDGGIACINIGDATRTVDGSFRVYQNHSRIIDAFERRGFDPLPELLWRKPVNSAAKFMGSGMLPPNAYVTLEHEYILLFRNGPEPREFEPGAARRYNSSFFWEERNRWFSDVWTDIRGELQELNADELRDRSAAFPFEIPYRLINMFSVYEDTVLDPFWGTGTTSLAAMVAGRESIGYELDDAFEGVFHRKVDDVPDISKQVIGKRIADHRSFVDEKLAAGDEFSHRAETYDFPVRTTQEKPILFYTVDRIEQLTDGYEAQYEPVSGDGGGAELGEDARQAASLSDF